MSQPNTPANGQGAPRFLISVPAVGPLAGAAGRTITIPDGAARVSDDGKYVNVTGERGFRSHATIDGVGLNLGFSAPATAAPKAKGGNTGANAVSAANRETIAAMIAKGAWTDAHSAAWMKYDLLGKSVGDFLGDILSGTVKIG